MSSRLFLIIISLLLISSCKSLKSSPQKSFRILPAKVVTILENNNPYSGLSEPGICINKTDSSNIIAGSIYDNIHISNDRGKTWKNEHLHSRYGVFGDPCLASDYAGNIYYLHLADPDDNRNSPEFLSCIVIQKSTDKGKTWTDGTAIGYNNKHHQDKHWIGIQPDTGELAVTWTEFDEYDSNDPEDKSRILFSKSTDFGSTWSKPVKINQLDGDCLDDDNTVEGAVPVYDRKGNIYVAWAYHDKIYFDKSTDGGKTWLEQDIIVANQPEGWNYDIPGVYRANGMPVLDIDISGGKYNGTLYVNWSDQRNGKNNTDIFISKSIDKGKTWSKPIKVNTDKTNTHQYLSWMKVDPVTGYIYIVYYDRSRYKDNQTDVSLAISKDGGKSFLSYIISDRPFVPRKNVFVGDYNNIDAYNNIVTPVWTDLYHNKISIKTTTLDLNRFHKSTQIEK
jgi:hypothetical protein